MKTIATTFAILAATAFSGVNTAQAQVVDPHIDQLALQLQSQSAAACREVYHHFRRSPHFQHAYSDLYEIYTLATHIHDIAHRPCELEHMREDVAEIDRLFHHTEDVVARMTQCPITGNGYHMRRLQALMRGLEDTIHHLDEDLNPVGIPGVNLPVPPSTGPALPPPPQTGFRSGYRTSRPLGYNGRTVSIGNDRIGISFSLGR